MEYINPRWRSYTIKGSSTPSCSLSAISIAKYGTVLGPATSPKGNSAVHNGLSARQQHDLMRQHLTLHHRLNTGRLLIQAASCRPFPDPVRVAAHLSQIRNKIRFSSAACKSQPGRVLGGHSNMGGGVAGGQSAPVTSLRAHAITSLSECRAKSTLHAGHDVSPSLVFSSDIPCSIDTA